MSVDGEEEDDGIPKYEIYNDKLFKQRTTILEDKLKEK
jgi:hypothetical protein